MLHAVIYALAFAALKFFGVIGISWWWIILAAFLLQVPASKTILFIVFKICGLFMMSVSWWFILIPILLDLVSAGHMMDPQ